MAPDEATQWWASLSSGAPTDLAGLWFGLVELVPGGWHIYVAGTETFDAGDEMAEWAVGPYAWWPEGRYLPFQPAGSDDIQSAVTAAASLVSGIEPWRAVPVRGVATGFDGGDFTIVYQR